MLKIFIKFFVILEEKYSNIFENSKQGIVQWRLAEYGSTTLDMSLGCSPRYITLAADLVNSHRPDKVPRYAAVTLSAGHLIPIVHTSGRGPVEFPVYITLDTDLIHLPTLSNGHRPGLIFLVPNPYHGSGVSLARPALRPF